MKHRMRRTPTVFQNVGEAHLNKIFSAGILRPSTLDLATAPEVIQQSLCRIGQLLSLLEREVGRRDSV